MIKLINEKVIYSNGNLINASEFSKAKKVNLDDLYKNTMTYQIIDKHNTKDTSKGNDIKIKFDCLASHDITYVGIVQTAKASGLQEFPLPYILTNCHNSLCAVGGTINEDDHMFGLSAAKRYGGIYVPAHQAVIHTYIREMMSGCGKMILGSDSHTRYGALGTMAIGEGGPELVKQLLNMTYDINYPDVISIELKGKPRHGVGPQDVALAIIGAVFKNGFVKNKVLEFVGDGIANLPIEYRNGIDVMTTETTCLSSIWQTDEKVKSYYKTHLREDAYKELKPKDNAMYDGAVIVNLDNIVPQIAMPFHPSNVYNLQDVIDNPYDILNEVEENAKKILDSNVNYKLTDKIIDNKVMVQQGIIAGCAGGTYDNIFIASKIMKDKYEGNNEFTMSVYPSSQPVYIDLVRKGAIADIMKTGAIVKTAFCGPCFGAGDVPSNNGLSIRHTTRNFENREGSKPSDGQIASVALMDSRSVAATAINGGVLTSAAEIDYDENIPAFDFDEQIYDKRVYRGYRKPDKDIELKYAPSIIDWPEIPKLADNLLLKVVAVINDPVTTTDELIPSGETSSYRSNPLRLAEFALSRKVPQYVERTKAVQKDNIDRVKAGLGPEYKRAIELAYGELNDILITSAIFATKPGDGSAREQAASSQRVLGGGANIAREYATKRYRSNLINWGMLPLLNEKNDFELNDIIIIKDIRSYIISGSSSIQAKLVRGEKIIDIELNIDPLTKEEKEIILSGCLINYYREKRGIK